MTEGKHEIQWEEVQVESMQTVHKKQRYSLITLVTLTLHNAVFALSLPYANMRPGDKFIASTVVFMSEPLKLVVNLFLVYWTESESWKHFISILHKSTIKQPIDTLNVGISSIVYVIQNNLLYVATSNLDAAVCQITLQLKIFTTAMFSVLLLKRKLLRHQWIALAVLIMGVILVQLQPDKKKNKTENTHPEQNRLIGLICAVIVCFLSGFAGVYFEKILKGAEITLWMRNIQLGCVSIPLSFIMCLKDWTEISNNGFFYGYDLYIVYLICLQAAGGVIISLVVKHADNILKGFASSLSIVVACVFSIYFFDFRISIHFVVGTLLVMLSIFLYSYTK